MLDRDSSVADVSTDPLHNEVARRQSNPHVCTVMSVLLSTLLWLGFFSFFLLHLSVGHSRDQPAPSRLAVS